jgi:hypothetical protein
MLHYSIPETLAAAFTQSYSLKAGLKKLVILARSPPSTN